MRFGERKEGERENYVVNKINNIEIDIRRFILCEVIYKCIIIRVLF